ncbi:MAG: C40 family peptidase [Ferrovum sp.]|nr:C40 family peptidase [Ferrovum sp.]NDU87059.1 C40 family peptidase [Ferrovum sp.]
MKISPRLSQGLLFLLLSGLLALPCRSEDTPPAPPSTPAPEVASPVRNILIYALSQVGASYRYGGNNTQGFDCSGFVRYVFSKAADLTLPHSSRDMSHVGQEVTQSQLQPGDLVFFRTQHQKISHVGIYLGNQQFVHASSTKTGSVMVSNLTERYWARRFATGKRLTLDDPPAYPAP